MAPDTAAFSRVKARITATIRNWGNRRNLEIPMEPEDSCTPWCSLCICVCYCLPVLPYLFVFCKILETARSFARKYSKWLHFDCKLNSLHFFKYNLTNFIFSLSAICLWILIGSLPTVPSCISPAPPYPLPCTCPPPSLHHLLIFLLTVILSLLIWCLSFLLLLLLLPRLLLLLLPFSL